MAKTISKFIVGRIALPLLGVEYSQQSANTARVVGSKNENTKNSTPFSTCNSGDIIISNVTNVLDVCIMYIYPIVLYYTYIIQKIYILIIILLYIRLYFINFI